MARTTIPSKRSAASAPKGAPAAKGQRTLASFSRAGPSSTTNSASVAPVTAPRGDESEAPVTGSIRAPSAESSSAAMAEASRMEAEEVRSTIETVYGPSSPLLATPVAANKSSEQDDINIEDAEKALKKVVALNKRGADVELTLEAVLHYMYLILLPWAVPILSPEVAQIFLTFSAAGLTALTLKCMFPPLRDYIDRCIRSHVIWDMKTIVEIMKTVDVNESKYRQGFYMIILIKAAEYCLYGGQSARQSEGGMFDRLFKEHNLKSYRKRYSSKPLYKAWNATTEAILAHALLLPIGYVAYNGNYELVLMETVLALLLCSWHCEAMKYSSLDLNDLLPHSMCQAFAKTCIQDGCTDISLDESNYWIMRKCLAFKAGKKVYGQNWSLPLMDNMTELALPATRLLQGARLHMNKRASNHYCATLGGRLLLNMFAADLEVMRKTGFDFDQPWVVATISKVDKPVDDNWAQVSPIKPTKINPRGYEDAPCIRMTVTWTCKDGSQHSHNLRQSGFSTTGLARSCLAMTVWEYANGDLATTSDFSNDRFRRDAHQSLKDQGEKAWTVGQPEHDELEKAFLFACPTCGRGFGSDKAVDTHRKASAWCDALLKEAKIANKASDKLFCPDPACDKKCQTLHKLTAHCVGVGQSKKSCRAYCASIGIFNAQDLSVRQGEFLTRPDLIGILGNTARPDAPLHYKCPCGTDKKNPNGYTEVRAMRTHLNFFEQAPGRVSKAPSSQTIACRAYFGLTEHSTHDDFAKLDRKLYTNPDWKGK